MNITLIGMTGVGKTLMGQELAKRLGFRFIDVAERTIMLCDDLDRDAVVKEILQILPIEK